MSDNVDNNVETDLTVGTDLTVETDPKVESDPKEETKDTAAPTVGSRLGLSGLKRTQRPEPVEPETSSVGERKLLERVQIPRPPKKEYDTNLPKSMRMTKKAHKAIATIATLEDLKQYEVLNMFIDDYLDRADPAIAKIVRSSIKRD